MTMDDINTINDLSPVLFSKSIDLSGLILEENETEILEVYPIEVYPIISWEMKDELEYVNAVQEFQKVTKELEEKANKVKSMRSKVKTIFDK